MPQFQSSHTLMSVKMKIFHLIFIAAIALISSCSSRHKLTMLDDLSEMIDTNPAKAHDSLISLSSRKMSAEDRAFLDFLTVKAGDKAYRKHTSDSILLRAINYAAKYPQVGYSTEVLYYAARVYHDIGDMPKAITYYQNTLVDLSKKRKSDNDIQFEANVMSQLASLLNKLKLYDQAIPYLKKIVNLDISLNDTLNLISDGNLLGHVWLNKKDYEKAHDLFRELKAMSLLCNKSTQLDIDISSMYLAVAKAHLDQIDSALLLLPTPENFTNKNDLSTLLAFSAQILKKAGKLDSAVYVARQLINLDSTTNNRNTGYEILLAPEYISNYPTDTLVNLVNGYAKTIDATLDGNQNQLALLQRAAYNYSSHEQEKIEAQKSSNYLLCIVKILLIVSLSMTVVAFILRKRNQRNLIKLHEVKQMLENPKSMMPADLDPSKNSEENIKVLQTSLREQLMQKYKATTTKSFSVPPEILESEPYARIIRHIKDDKPVNPKDNIWKELEELLYVCAPNFKTSLNILTGGSLSDNEIRTLLLIRCGFAPNQIAKVEGRALSTIGSRRMDICRKIMGNSTTLGTKDIDSIIRLI